MSTLTGHVAKLWTHVFPCAVATCVHVVPPRVAGSSLWTRPEGALGSVRVALVVLLPVSSPLEVSAADRAGRSTARQGIFVRVTSVCHV